MRLTAMAALLSVTAFATAECPELRNKETVFTYAETLTHLGEHADLITGQVTCRTGDLDAGTGIPYTTYYCRVLVNGELAVSYEVPPCTDDFDDWFSAFPPHQSQHEIRSELVGVYPHPDSGLPVQVLITTYIKILIHG